MWGKGHTPFEITGNDTIIAVSPFENTLFTCEPELIAQLLRNPAFGKPTKTLGLLNAFGPSLTGTDGQENKHYRRIAGPFFNNKTMTRVFRETVEATESFLNVMENRKSAIGSQLLRPVLAKLALHILGKGAFDKEGSCLDELTFTETPPEGHKLSWADTRLGIDQILPLIALTPAAVLKYSPLQIHKRGHMIRTEMSNYLQEAVDRKRSSAKRKEADSKSMLDILVGAGEEGALSPPQVTGNIFIINFAGHEANAMGIQFSLSHLACRPEMQRQVQQDIDRIVGDLLPERWDFDQHYTALAESMVGAVINEALRVYTVIPILPKHTIDTPIEVTIRGKKHVILPHTMIFVNTSATHRNPRYWPAQTHTAYEKSPYAFSMFNPYQWFSSDKDGKFLDPEPGSFVPFSDGGRGCLGQRFARVELCVTLARILKNHSVELAVGADDKDDLETKRRKWEAARAHAEYELSGGIIYNMTLRLSGDIPINFVKRGREQFYTLS